MNTPYALWIATRYLRSRRRERFSNFVTGVAIAGMALGIAVLIVVLSVMNGFEREVLRHVLGMSAHGLIVPLDGALETWRAEQQRLSADPLVQSASPYARGDGMLSRGREVRGVAVEGIDIAVEGTRLLRAGYLAQADFDRLEANSEGVLLGNELARALGVRSGDSVTLVLPDWDDEGRALTPRYHRLPVSGTFEVGMHHYDSRIVIAHIRHAQALFGLGDSASGIRVRFNNAAAAPFAVRTLAQSFSEAVGVIDWTQYHRNFFLALESQKRIMFIVLVLVVAVAAFNIAANMVMVVSEKLRDVAILRTMGAAKSTIVAIFLLHGLFIGLCGAIAGAALGAWGAAESEVVAAYLEALLGIDLINADVYFIDYLPAEVRGSDVVLVTAAALLLSLLATLYPALRAAAADPAPLVHRD